MEQNEKSRDDSARPIDRRQFLLGAGALGALGLAGCLGDGDTGDTPTGAGTPPGETTAPTGGTTTEPTPTDDPPTDTQTPTPTPQELNVLVLSVTHDHTSHPTEEGIEAIEDIAATIAAEREFVVGYSVDVVADHGAHADTVPEEFPRDVDELAEYDVIVNNNSNDASPPNSTAPILFDDEQAAAFESYIRAGGGMAALHAASACQTIDSTYTDILGAYFNEETTSPRVQEMTLTVTDRTHPSTRHLPAEWDVETEMYSWYDDPRGDVHVLASVDETTYDGPTSPGNGHRHPVAWCQDVGAGRSWYTQLGHRAERFDDEDFLRHLRGGIEWAAGLVNGDATGTVWDSYEKTQLVDDTESPSVVKVAPSGNLYYVDRTNYNDVADSTEELRVSRGEAFGSETVIELPVADRRLPGLRSFVLDPKFEDNRRMYLYYHPPMNEIEEGHFRLSRFTMREDELELDPDSEEVILEVPKYEFDINDSRGGHCGGNLAWGPEGDELYLTTGDDTYWGASDAYTPIDERSGREWNDAQRTSGNTNDLRGSVLRIRPTEDGGYEVPEDNLFTEENGYGDEIEAGVVKPEMYAMGMRNPYRMAVDSATGTPYVADYGPDAGSWDAGRGPPALTEYTRLDEPGFYGWPYFSGDIPFRDYDFDSGESGQIFDPENPTNDSPNNDGLTELPPAQGTQLPSPYDWDGYLDYPSEWEPYVPYTTMAEVPFPQVTGGSPMIGTVFREDDAHGSNGLSEYFDGKVFIMQRGLSWIKYLTYDEAGNLVDVEPFLPGTDFIQPMDMTVGPDGALYVIEWGSGYEGPNPDSGIYKIELKGGGEPTLDTFGLTGGELRGQAGETVTVEAALTNPLRTELENGQLALSAAGELSVSPVEGTIFQTLGPNGSQKAVWEVVIPESAGGSYELGIEATYTRTDTGSETTLESSATLVVPDAVSVPFGLNAGGESAVTVNGVEYLPTPHDAVEVVGDADASGSNEAVAVSGIDSEVSNTENDTLYQSLQYGGNLSYEITVENGTYDVTLHLLENVWTSPGERVFDVSIEGELQFEGLDIYDEVGTDTALIKTVENVEVTDGALSVHTETQMDNSSICGIGIWPPDSDRPWNV